MKKILDVHRADKATMTDGAPFAVPGTDVLIWIRPAGTGNAAYQAAAARAIQKYRRFLALDPGYPPAQKASRRAFFDHCVVRWEGNDLVEDGAPTPLTWENFDQLCDEAPFLLDMMSEFARDQANYRAEDIASDGERVGN